MPDRSLRALVLLSAVASAVLYGVVAAILVDAPPIQADGAAVLAWVRPHRSLVLGGVCTWSLCVAATWTFLTAAWGVFTTVEGKPGVLSLLAWGAGFATFTLSLVGFSAALTLAWLAAELGPEAAHVLNSLALLPVSITGMTTALSIVPWIVLARRHALFSLSLQTFSAVVTALHLVSMGAFAADGPLSPSGVGMLVAPLCYYAWTVWVGVELWKGYSGRSRTISPS